MFTSLVLFTGYLSTAQSYIRNQQLYKQSDSSLCHVRKKYVFYVLLENYSPILCFKIVTTCNFSMQYARLLMLCDAATLLVQ